MLPTTSQHYAYFQTQIIAEFQRDGIYLPALALTVCWGAMWRQQKRIYDCGLDEIQNALAQCAGSIVATNSIEQSWRLLTGNGRVNRGWTSVMASKALHFLCRALGYEQKPPVPIDGKVIRERVWPCFSQPIPEPRPGDWNGNDFDAYRRYMTAIVTWADVKGWTTTQVEINNLR